MKNRQFTEIAMKNGGLQPVRIGRAFFEVSIALQRIRAGEAVGTNFGTPFPVPAGR